MFRLYSTWRLESLNTFGRPMHITQLVLADKAELVSCRIEFRKGRTEKGGGDIIDRLQMKNVVAGSGMGS